LRGDLYRIFGVDLTEIPGISGVTAHTILCEIGPDTSQFRNASAFVSWLGLCPETQISGGKVLFTKSRRVRSRVALALRMAANSLHHADNYLGEFFRRIARKLGKPQGITATAHKLARIVFHLLSTKEPYQESVFLRCEEKLKSVLNFGSRNMQPNSAFRSSQPRTRNGSLGVGQHPAILTGHRFGCRTRHFNFQLDRYRDSYQRGNPRKIRHKMDGPIAVSRTKQYAANAGVHPTS
jgi:hypothetical protein